MLTYTCLCGLTHTVLGSQARLARLWGSKEYALRFRHQCPACARVNWVHAGRIVQSLQAGKTRR
jgi:hypothetical protein